MSIAFGIYDFFSYTIPGLIYLIVINQILGLFKLPNINIDNLNANLGYALLGIIIAYVVGHLMDTIARRWFFLFYQDNLQKRLIDRLKENYPGLKIEFDIKDLRILFSFIRHHQLELAESIEKYKVINIMLQNISLALLLFGIQEIVAIIRNGFSITAGMLLITAFSFSMIALRRSALFNDWYWSAIFVQALHYGSNILEMFGKPSKKAMRKKV
jgi:hypothetical protein